MGKGTGYGKIILFGEHFVVHGVPAIAAALSNKVTVKVEKAKETSFESSDLPGVVPDMTIASIDNIRKAMKVKDHLKVDMDSDLPRTGGLGSSAAFCVGLVRAIADEYDMKLSNDKASDYAYEGEKAFHGNPSGVDNTMAAHGGVMLFTRGKTKNKFEKINIDRPLNLVIGMTGIYSPTADMVALVKRNWDDAPEEFNKLAEQEKELIKKARFALENGGFRELGLLMDENQTLLGKIGVSHIKNEQLNLASKRAGALGAKITGGGGGGSCIALARDEGHAKQILNELKNSGFQGFITTVSS